MLRQTTSHRKWSGSSSTSIVSLSLLAFSRVPQFGCSAIKVELEQQLAAKQEQEFNFEAKISL